MIRRCHHSASFKHPSNRVAASNLYHGTRNDSGNKLWWSIGFDLCHEILFNPQLLNIKTGHTFVDLGGGRADPSIVLNLCNPRVRAVSIEINEGPHKEAEEWIGRINWKNVGDAPEVINADFLDEQFKELLQGTGLRIWFNNYKGKMTRTYLGGRGIMAGVNVQSKLEDILSENCAKGTVVASFDSMFINRLGGQNCIWDEEIIEFEAGKVDIDWYENQQQTKLYRYTRINGNEDRVIPRLPRKRKSACPYEIERRPVLGLATLEGTDWEEAYGKQKYPVIIFANQKVRYMVEEPTFSRHGDSMFEPHSEKHEGELIPIYKEGRFNAGEYIEHIVYGSFALLSKKATEVKKNAAATEKQKNDQQKLLDDFVRRSLHFFTEMSLLSYGSNETLKQSCSYVRVSRWLLSALISLRSRAVFEFGAGKGVLFSTLKMYRHYNYLPTNCDVAIDCREKVSEWCTFVEGELSQLERLGCVQYLHNKMSDEASFRECFRNWRSKVSNEIRECGWLNPELLLISWPNSDDQDFVSCVRGWHAAGGQRLAVIFDRSDPEATVPGPFLDEVPGTSWTLMKNVLHDEGSVKTYSSHMPLMPWGSSSLEVYQDSECSYGLYVYQRAS